jgi:hypothetical protein
MAYTPPNTFTTGTILQSADLQGNLDALRVYTHDGVAGADLSTASRWADTRHVQAPYVVPAQGLQHGVSGWQGGPTLPYSSARVSFLSSFLTGRQELGAAWTPIPDTAFRVSIRAPATVLFHWWTKAQGGPDSAVRGAAAADRYGWVAPYLGGPEFTVKSAGQEVGNNHAGFNPASPEGALEPYTWLGESNMAGTYLHSTNGPASVTIGLAATSTLDRAVLLSWGVFIEAWYL